MSTMVLEKTSPPTLKRLHEAPIGTNVFAGGPLQSYLFVLYPMELKQFKNVDERWEKRNCTCPSSLMHGVVI